MVPSKLPWRTAVEYVPLFVLIVVLGLTHAPLTVSLIAAILYLVAMAFIRRLITPTGQRG
jgi:hypothetical protein